MFLFFRFGFEQREYKSFTIKGKKKSPDYILRRGKEKIVVEIGGKVKDRKQLEDFKGGIIVKDVQLMCLGLV